MVDPDYRHHARNEQKIKKMSKKLAKSIECSIDDATITVRNQLNNKRIKYSKDALKRVKRSKMYSTVYDGILFLLFLSIIFFFLNLKDILYLKIY